MDIKKNSTEGRLTLFLPPRQNYVNREVQGDEEHLEHGFRNERYKCSED